MIARLVAALIVATTSLALTAQASQAAEAGPAGEAAAISTNPAGHSPNSAFLVLVPEAESSPAAYDEAIARGLARIPALSIGLTSSTQGSYRARQALLDISQGARVSRSTYSPPEPGPVFLTRRPGGSGRIGYWNDVLERAESAPQTIEPGLLGGSLPTGAGWVGPRPIGPPANVNPIFRRGTVWGDLLDLREVGLNRTTSDNAATAVPAADRRGRIAGISVTEPADRADRALRMARELDLVVVTASPGRRGLAQLRQILEGLGPDQLLIAMQRPPDASILPLLPIGVAGLDGPPSGLTSDTTNTANLVAGIDIAPTVLDHLGITIPDEMTGSVMRSDGDREPAELSPYRDRLDDLGPRRTPALTLLAVGWLVLFLVYGAIAGLERARFPVRRIGGLAILWIPTVIMIPPLLGNPSREIEYAVIALSALGLGWIADRLLPWPRAPLIPAVVGLALITFDLAADTNLITRSILGPNPGYGSRFYGIGNELKSGLMVLLLAGLAAAMSYRPRSNRAALTVIGSGLVLGVILGSGRLGAGVGAAIIVAAATAVTAVLMLPGELSRKRILILVVSPIIGLAVLAGLDLLTAGGQGHFSRSVLSLDSSDSFFEIVERRSSLAWQQLRGGNTPLVTAICLLAAAFAIRNRKMFEPFAGPIWPAALIGGLVGGLIGSVTEDSGPLLIIVATVTLAGVCSYLLGRPGAAVPAIGSDRTGPDDGDGLDDAVGADDRVRGHGGREPAG